MRTLSVAVLVALLAVIPARGDGARLASGQYAHMQMKLEKTLLGIDAVRVDIWFDEVTRDRFRELAEGHSYSEQLAERIARTALEAEDVHIQLVFLRHASLSEFLDAVRDQVERDIKLLDDLGFKLVYALDTHVHADHITASGVLRRRLGSKTVLSANAGVECADILVKQDDVIRFGNYALEVRETPGHTNGCVTYVTADKRMAFTGDAMLIRGCGRTDFQQGDPRKLYSSVRDQIFTLPDSVRRSLVR